MPLPPFDAPCWSRYTGGYNRQHFDVRPLIARFQAADVDDALWELVWTELYHQGDVGEASYALVGSLAEYLARVPQLDAQALHFAVAVELARDSSDNPPLPPELRDAYDGALRELSRVALTKADQVWPEDVLQGVAALVAVTHGHPVLGEAYQNMDTEAAASFLRDEMEGE